MIELENVVREARQVTYNETVNILNLIEDKYFFEFFDILLDKHINTQKYISFLGKVKMNMSLSSFMEGIIPFMVRGIYASNAVVIDALDESEVEQYKKLFKKFNVEDLAYVLNTLVTIKESSSDLEAKLMLLGYTGIHKPQEQTIMPEYIDNTKESALIEKKAGDEEYQKSIMVTEEETMKKIENFGQSMDFEAIASQFGGIVVKK